MKPHQGEKQTEKASNIKLGKGEFLVKKKNEHQYVKEECYLCQQYIFVVSFRTWSTDLFQPITK